MKKIILILIIAIGGWVGYSVYKTGNLPSLNSLDSSMKNLPAVAKKDPVAAGEQLKCTTKDGNIIYGIVPPEIECVKKEAVKGSLTIIENMGGSATVTPGK